MRASREGHDEAVELSRLRERQAQTNGRARGGRRAMRWLPLFAFLATAPLATGQQARGWEPPPPPPDEFDWVQLTSGEWLKGEIVDLYRKELAFDSDELDLQVLDWEDVKELRSAAPMRATRPSKSSASAGQPSK